MNNTAKPKSEHKAGRLIGAVLLTVSVSGFFMGLRQTSSQISMTRLESIEELDWEEFVVAGTNRVPTAVNYSSQDWLKNGPNAQWKSRLGFLIQPAKPTNAVVALPHATDRAAALANRAARRAFDGAPPVVPHPIAQDSSASCLACHGAGLAIKDKVSTKISHEKYSSCTQCHVASTGTLLPVDHSPWLEPIAANSFEGAAAPLKGTRAWPQAPPTIPHRTGMRGDCMSCHGPLGLFGLRTPHPERQACHQCHVPEAGIAGL